MRENRIPGMSMRTLLSMLAAIALFNAGCADDRRGESVAGAGGSAGTTIDGGAGVQAGTGGGEAGTGGGEAGTGGSEAGSGGSEAGSGGTGTGGSSAGTGGGEAGSGGSGDEIRVPTCPGPNERCDSDRCVEGEPCVKCPEGQVCLEVEIICGPSSGINAQCVEDPCVPNDLHCDCADSLCEDLYTPPLFCTLYDQEHFLVGPDRDPFVSCMGGGVCASPDTPVATPDGDRPIALLSAGDRVFSVHRGRVEAVPILRTSRVSVSGHRVRRLTLANGAVLEISAGHPTADGRTLGDLRPGDRLDGVEVIVAETIPYAHPFTYDILPDSDTGAYFAAGVLIGSTL
jgi:hypothetical protein